MRNIGNTFKEFSIFYAALYPYDSIDIIEKIMKITSLLKQKKFRKIDGFINLLVTQIKNFLQVCRKLDDNKDKSRRYQLYHKRNEIVEKEVDKIFDLIEENKEKNSFITQYLKNIEKFIENSLNILYQTETEKDKKDVKYKNISHPEVILYFNLLMVYIIPGIDKKSDLFKKIVQFVINNIIINKSPVSSRILWIKRLYTLISEENKSYQNFEWIIFKSDEEFSKFWNEIKNEVEGKFIIPYPIERICKKKFCFDDSINNNSKYNFNLEEFLISMAEVDEYEEDQKYIKKNQAKKYLH